MSKASEMFVRFGVGLADTQHLGAVAGLAMLKEFLSGVNAAEARPQLRVGRVDDD